jgi:hypothetical protein
MFLEYSTMLRYKAQGTEKLHFESELSLLSLYPLTHSHSKQPEKAIQIIRVMNDSSPLKNVQNSTNLRSRHEWNIYFTPQMRRRCLSM